MLLRTDESGQPYVDIGRTPLLDDGTRLTLVADPGWDAGGPVLRYRRYKADGSLYSHGPDIPIGRAVDNALGVLFLHSLHLGLDATNLATSPFGTTWLPIMADRFAGEGSWRFESPEMGGRVNGYIYAAFTSRGSARPEVEFNDPKLAQALDLIFPVYDTLKDVARTLYSGDGVTLRFRDVINVARYTRRGVLEIASPLWEKQTKSLPTYRLLGDAYIMIQQAAAFFRTLGQDGSLVGHFRLTNVKGWRLHDENSSPLETTDADIGPFTIGPSKADRASCFRFYATRLFNHFGMPECNLISEDGRPTTTEGKPLDIKNLPQEERNGR
jgi:hypothetical protein